MLATGQCSDASDNSGGSSSSDVNTNASVGGFGGVGDGGDMANGSGVGPGSGAGPGSGGAGGIPMGTGGEGGGIPCDSPSDCPGVDDTCQTRTCDNQECGVINASAGTPCTENFGNECDGNGACAAVDAWVKLPTGGAPSARNLHTAVWTGTDMIIWGGRTGAGQETNTGYKYNPASNSWSAISNSGAPIKRHSHKAIWTGTEMIVWGGFGSGAYRTDGGRYNPTSNTWSPVTGSGAPSARTKFTMVWTTNLGVLVWGGLSPAAQALGTGGRYNENTNSWTAINNTGAPSPRFNNCGLWEFGGNHRRLIVWGGTDTFDWLGNGAEYNPVNNTWQPMGTGGNPMSFRESMACIEVGKIIFMWGGWNGGPYFNDGRRYDHAVPPPGNTWYFMDQVNSPAKRSNMVTLYLGGNNRFFVWGGCGGQACSTIHGDGGQYVTGPNGGVWQIIPESPNLQAREDHTAVWTGSEVIIWGGRKGTSVLGDGARNELEAITPP